MSVLNDILVGLEKSDIDEQVKVICDMIMLEETPKFMNPYEQPTGPNVFLAIEFDDKKNFANYLCLEREAKEKYIVTLWSKKKQNDPVMKRKQVWEVIETKPEKIIKFYAESLKFIRGE